MTKDELRHNLDSVIRRRQGFLFKGIRYTGISYYDDEVTFTNYNLKPSDPNAFVSVKLQAIKDVVIVNIPAKNDSFSKEIILHELMEASI